MLVHLYSIASITDNAPLLLEFDAACQAVQSCGAAHKDDNCDDDDDDDDDNKKSKRDPGQRGGTTLLLRHDYTYFIQMT